VYVHATFVVVFFETPSTLIVIPTLCHLLNNILLLLQETTLNVVLLFKKNFLRVFYIAGRDCRGLVKSGNQESDYIIMLLFLHIIRG